MKYGFAAEALSSALRAKFPGAYLESLKERGGGDVFDGEELLRLYPLDELSAANREYHVDEFLPGCALFGSDGCGNAFLFDSGEILKCPFIPLDRSFAKRIGSDFLALLPKGLVAPQNPATAGKEIHEKHPVVLGGNPSDPANKIFLDPPIHAQASTYFNLLVRQLRAQAAR